MATPLRMLLLVFLAVPAMAQDTALPAEPKPLAANAHSANAPARFDSLFGRYLFRYTPRPLAPFDLADSPGDPERAALLVAHGEIRLSLTDAIALAVENNLDVESVRLLSPMARADLARARSGQLLRNLSSATDTGQGSAAGTLATASPFGFEGNGAVSGAGLTSLAVPLAGSPIPNIEPVFFANGRVNHNVLPLANLTVTGTNYLNSKDEELQFGVRKGFFTGTNLTVSFDALRTSRNAPFDSIDPAIAGDVLLRVDQHLLQGFGRATNMRAIHVAQNNGRIAELTFRQQLILTVAQVQGLYLDLVSFRQQRDVIGTAAERDRKLLDDTRKQMDLGLLAQSDVIEAQIRLDSDQQSLTDAEAQIAEQEATLKSVLTHAGLEDPAIAHARLVPTDGAAIPMDSDDDPEKIADLAIAQRLELKQADLSLTNKHLSLLGTKNALRPTFDLYVTLQNNALAGQLNRYAPSNIVAATDPNFIGGFGSVLSQLSRRAYPDYEFGFQLNVPLVNRAAQADMARDRIDLRQQEIARQSLRNGIRLQAMKSAFALRQSRSQYELSVKARKLLEQSLDTEKKMFDFGTSDATRLQSVQAALDRARIREITALNTYARAHINLRSVLGETLEDNHIVLDPPAK